MRRERVGQPRDADAAAAKRKPAVRIEPVGGVYFGEFCGRESGDASARIRRPIERGVVNDDDLAVGCEANIDLETVSAGATAALEGEHRVFRAERAAATVGQDQRTRAAEGTMHA
jgi:hypothetical protein